jgi:hypothetical protein
MFKILDEYADNSDFQEFLNREFNSTAANEKVSASIQNQRRLGSYYKITYTMLGCRK